MLKGEALEFCERWLPAWTGNRPEVLAQFYSDDVFYCDPGKPKGIRGKEKLLSYFHKLLIKYPDWTWKAVEVFPFENGFILKWEAKLNKDKTSESFFGLDIVEIKDKKIIRNEVFFDLVPFIMQAQI